MKRLQRIACLLTLALTPSWGAAQQPAGGPKAEEGVEKEYLPLVRQLKDKDPKVRLKAVADLAAKGEAAASTATAVCDAIQDVSPRVGEAALVALEKIRPDLYKPVSTMLLERDPALIVRAIQSLAILGNKAAPARNLLLSRMRSEALAYARGGRDDAPLTLVIDTIQQIDPADADALAMRKTLAGNGNKSVGSRLGAIDALVRWAGDDAARRKSVVDTVATGLLVDALTVNSVRHLATFGPLAKPYLPTLKKLKLHPDATVREAAGKAVDAIEGM